MVTRKRKSSKTVQVEDTRLYNYEMVLIISPEVAEEKFDAAIDNVSRFITDSGGSVSEVEQWGKRKLAYPVKRQGEGSYVLTRFSLKPSLSKELEAKLEISEDVLRHLLIRLN